MLNLSCPECGSNNTQKLSLAVDGGTFNTNSTSIGIGVSAGGLGVGGASSKGASTSKFAEKNAAPEKMPVVTGFISIMVLSGLSMLLFGRTAIQWGFWIGLGYAILALVYNLKSFPREFAEWDAKFLCQRCSAIFTPKAGSDEELVGAQDVAE